MAHPEMHFDLDSSAERVVDVTAATVLFPLLLSRRQRWRQDTG